MTDPAITDPLTALAAQPPAPRRTTRPITKTRRFTFGADFFMGLLTRGSAVAVVLMLASLIFVLARAALPAITTFGWGFITGTEWRPNEREVPKRGPDGKVVIEDGEVVIEILPAQFGAAPVIYGTAITSALALVFAVPLSLGAALFLVRVAPRAPTWMTYSLYLLICLLLVRLAFSLTPLGPVIQWLGTIVVAAGLAATVLFLAPKPTAPISFLIEFLAAVPSIAYGIWGLFVLVPFLQSHIEPVLASTVGRAPGMGWLVNHNGRPISLTGRDMFSGGLILAIMVLPIITAVSRDVLRAVPRAQIEGTLALGATWWQSCWEMLRYSRSGLFGAIMLGLARAAGETMAVTMVIGNNNQIVASIFAPAQTMSSLLANEFAEASGVGLQRAALVEVALILLGMSLAFNVIARYLVVGGSSRTAAAH